MTEKTARKRKAPVPKVREAAREYRTKSTKSEESLGEAFWLAFQQLPDEAQGHVIRRMLADPEWFEELADSIISIEREGEPERPYEQVREEMIRNGLL